MKFIVVLSLALFSNYLFAQTEQSFLPPDAITAQQRDCNGDTCVEQYTFVASPDSIEETLAYIKTLVKVEAFSTIVLTRTGSNLVPAIDLEGEKDEGLLDSFGFESGRITADADSKKILDRFPESQQNVVKIQMPEVENLAPARIQNTGLTLAGGNDEVRKKVIVLSVIRAVVAGTTAFTGLVFGQHVFWVAALGTALYSASYSSVVQLNSERLTRWFNRTGFFIKKDSKKAPWRESISKRLTFGFVTLSIFNIVKNLAVQGALIYNANDFVRIFSETMLNTASGLGWSGYTRKIDQKPDEQKTTRDRLTVNYISFGLSIIGTIGTILQQLEIPAGNIIQVGILVSGVATWLYSSQKTTILKMFRNLFERAQKPCDAILRQMFPIDIKSPLIR